MTFHLLFEIAKKSSFKWSVRIIHKVECKRSTRVNLWSLLFLIYINNLWHLFLFSTVQIIITSTVSLNHEYWTVGLLDALSKHNHKMKKRICLKKCLIYCEKKISQILGWMLTKCKIKIFSHASGWLLTKRKTKKSLISFILWNGRWFSLPSELFKTKREINKFTLIL